MAAWGTGDRGEGLQGETECCKRSNQKDLHCLISRIITKLQKSRQCYEEKIHQ